MRPQTGSPAPAPLPRKQPTAAAKPPPQAAPPPRKPAASGSNSLSEDRIRAIHQSYQVARQKTNATAVSFEKLERSIRETERKLREKSKGRAVDFEVSIKEGKAILKPRLK
jgi:hypothetical protein